MMLEELQRRNYAPNTIDAYLRSVEHLSKHFKRSPDQLTREHLREYQAYLLHERKLEPRTVSTPDAPPVAATRKAVTRPPFEVADIIRQHGDPFIETLGAWLPPHHP